MSKRFSKMSWIVLAALLCLSLVLVPGCTTPGEQEEEEEEISIPLKNPNDFVQQSIGDVDSLDYAWAYDTASGEQLDYIYETLLKYDREATTEFVFVLATEEEIVSTTQIRFKIREGVTFHEGGTLTPEDVEYSFERTIVQDRGGGPAWMLNIVLLGRYRTRSGGEIVVTGEDIDNTIEVDGDWVVFNFASDYPMVQWKQILTQCWASIVDKEWCVANGEWDGDLTGEGWKAYNNPEKQDTYLFDKANGTGPWELDIWESGDYIRLVKTDNYWGEPVFFEKVISQTVDEWTSRKLALLNGDADFVYVPRQYIGELEGIEDIQAIKDLAELTNMCVFFNFAIDPASDYIGSGALDGNGIPPDFFTDLDVRKGFCYAFDYQIFLDDVWQGEALLQGSPLVKPLQGYDPNADRYTLNMDLAEQHLKAAWGGELWEKGCQFTLTYNTGNDQRKTACDILATGLASLNDNFRVSVLALAWPTFLDGIFTETDTSKGPIPVFVIGWKADYPDADNFVTPYMHSEGDFSYYQGYGNAELDEKIEAARYEPDEAARITMYKELHDIYHEDPAGIMLAQPLGRRWFTKYVKGFYFNPTISGNAGPLDDMSKSES